MRVCRERERETLRQRQIHRDRGRKGGRDKHREPEIEAETFRLRY